MTTITIDRALLERVLDAIESFKLPESSVVAARAGELTLRVPLETIQKQAAVLEPLREALQAKPVELDLSNYVIVTNAEFFPRRLSDDELVEKTRTQMKCIYCDEPADFTHTCPQSRQPVLTFIDPVAEMDKTSANLDKFQHVHFSDPGKGLCVTSSDMVKWLIANKAADYFKEKK